MQPTSTIGQRIKTVRGELSQKAFGARVGLSQTAVTALENDLSEPRLGTFTRIVEAFCISPDWLRAGMGPMRAEAPAPTVADAPPLAPTATAEVVARLIEQLAQQAQEHRAELAATKKDARATFEVTIKALQFTLETMKTTNANERQTVLELKHDIYHLRLAAGQRQPTVEEQEYMDRQAQRKGKPAGFKSYEPSSRFSVGVSA